MLKSERVHNRQFSRALSKLHQAQLRQIASDLARSSPKQARYPIRQTPGSLLVTFAKASDLVDSLGRSQLLGDQI